MSVLNLTIPYNKRVELGEQKLAVGKSAFSGDTNQNFTLEKLLEINLRNSFPFLKDLKSKISYLLSIIPQAKIQEVLQLSASGRNAKELFRNINANRVTSKQVIENIAFVFKFSPEQVEKLKLPKNSFTLFTDFEVYGLQNNLSFNFSLQRIEIMDLPYEEVDGVELIKITEIKMEESNILKSADDLSSILNNLSRTIDLFNENSSLKLLKWENFVFPFLTFLESKRDKKFDVFSTNDLMVSEEFDSQTETDTIELILVDRSNTLELTEKLRYIFNSPNDSNIKAWMTLKSKKEVDFVGAQEKN